MRNTSDGYLLSCHSSHLADYTSRILASQQAAHDAEIAKLKEEIEHKDSFNRNLFKSVEETNDRIAYLEGPVALQADALKEIACFTQSTNLLWWQVEARKAISATAETVQAFRDKLTEPLRREVGRNFNLC